VPPENVHVIPLGVDTRLFHPRPGPGWPAGILAVASADSPIKGVATLLARGWRSLHRTERPPRVVGKPVTGGPTERLVAELALGRPGALRHRQISDPELLPSSPPSAGDRVVPSLYEGSRSRRSSTGIRNPAGGQPDGALPEVTGDAAVLVDPRRPPRNWPPALRRLHDSADERARLGDVRMAPG